MNVVASGGTTTHRIRWVAGLIGGNGLYILRSKKGLTNEHVLSIFKIKIKK